MIVIDIEAIKSNFMCKQVVGNMVLQNLKRMKKKNGEPFYIPSRPVYWFSKHQMTIKDLESEGYPAIGTVWQVASTVQALQYMVDRVDEVAVKMGMQATGRFRNPVYVVTNKDFSDIENLGAKPLPVQLFGAV